MKRMRCTHDSETGISVHKIPLAKSRRLRADCRKRALVPPPEIEQLRQDINQHVANNDARMRMQKALATLVDLEEDARLGLWDEMNSNASMRKDYVQLADQLAHKTHAQEDTVWTARRAVDMCSGDVLRKVLPKDVHHALTDHAVNAIEVMLKRKICACCLGYRHKMEQKRKGVPSLRILATHVVLEKCL